MTLRAAGYVGVSLWLALAPAWAGDASARSPAEIMDILMWNREPVGGPFELIDQTGRVRTERDFRGRLLLVYFGFTFCPDVCPTDLQAIGLALDKLGGDADSVQPLFITVDPERDTPRVLKAYAANFSPRLVALSGSAEEIAAVAKAYRIYYKKVGEGADYSMDHTGLIYLMGPDGRYLAHFSPEATADDIVKDLRQRF